MIVIEIPDPLDEFFGKGGAIPDKQVHLPSCTCPECAGEAPAFTHSHSPAAQTTGNAIDEAAEVEPCLAAHRTP